MLRYQSYIASTVILVACIALLSSCNREEQDDGHEYFDDGSLRSEAIYNKEGKLHGVMKKYFPDGRVRQEREFRDGQIIIKTDWEYTSYGTVKRVRRYDTGQHDLEIITFRESKKVHKREIQHGNCRETIEYWSIEKPRLRAGNCRNGLRALWRANYDVGGHCEKAYRIEKDGKTVEDMSLCNPS